MRAVDKQDRFINLSAMQSSERSKTTIVLQVNGTPKTCEPNTNMPQLLNWLGLNPRLVAVEYNGEILHRQLWADTILQEGDRLEIVTIVGGG